MWKYCKIVPWQLAYRTVLLLQVGPERIMMSQKRWLQINSCIQILMLRLLRFHDTRLIRRAGLAAPALWLQVRLWRFMSDSVVAILHWSQLKIIWLRGRFALSHNEAFQLRTAFWCCCGENARTRCAAVTASTPTPKVATFDLHLKLFNLLLKNEKKLSIL